MTLEVEVPVPGKECGEEAAALGPSYPVLAEAPVCSGETVWTRSPQRCERIQEGLTQVLTKHRA